jgi:MFS transporter, SP family, sugar:H+ symporter
MRKSPPSSTHLLVIHSHVRHSHLGSKVFFVWGGFCCICVAFVFFCIYETKGLSLEQVDELYAKVSLAWQSKNFVPTVNFHEIQETIAAGGHDGRRSTLADLEQATVRRKSSAGVHVEHAGGEKYEA